MLTAVTRKSLFSLIMLMAPALALTTVTVPAVTVRKTFQQEVDGYTGTRDTWLQVRYERENWNAGGDDTLHTSGHANAGANRREALIRFENVFGPGGIPAEITAADIVSATLTMTVYKGLELNDLRVYAFVTPWTAGNTANGPAGEGESTAAHRFHRAGGVYAGTDHWGVTGVQNTFPTMDDVSHVVGNLHYTAQIDAFGPVDYMTDGVKNVDAWPVDLDVTIAVRGWLDGTIENHGFLLRSHGSTWQTYDMYSSLYPNHAWRPRLTIEYVPRTSTSFQQGVDGYSGTGDTWLQTQDGRENRNAGGHPALRTHGHAYGASGDESRRRDSLIRFDNLFGPGALAGSLTADDIIRATLTMTVYRANDINDLRVYAMITPWEAGDKDNAPAGDGESTAAHRFHRVDGNYTPADYWGVAGTAVEFPTMDDAYGELHQSDYLDAAGPFDYMGNGVFGENGWPVDLDVTEAVKGWLNGTIANHGFWLRSHGSWWSYYDMYSSDFTGNPEWRPRLTIEYFPRAVTHPIELQPGHQFISSNLMPLEMDLRTSIFAGLIERGSLDFVRDSTGRTMQRIAGQWLNPIGEWTSTGGYLVHMNQADVLQLEGEELDPRTPIELVPGYQFVAYLPSYQLTAAEAFASLKDNGLVSVRDSEGGTLRQAGGQWVDDLGLMKAGRGYLVRMSEPATLVYPAAKPLPLVVDGEARAVVVTADNPTPVASLAVAELVAHFSRASGMELNVVRESEAPSDETIARLYVGLTSAAVAQGIRVQDLPLDGFVLRSDSRDIFIVGKEDYTEYRSGSGLNGTLYGVYEFLERTVGVLWLWPGELGTYVPRSDTIVFERFLNETITPAFDFGRARISHLVRQVNNPDPDNTRLGFSEHVARDYLADIEIFQRRYRVGYTNPKPRVGHHFSGWWERLGHLHPEWFMLNEEGERGPLPGASTRHVAVCVSNPNLHQYILEEDWDGGNVLSLGEVDARVFCNCDDCLDWDGPQPADPPSFARADYTPRVVSDRYARFWKTIYDQAVQINPNVTVTSFLYWNYLPAPLSGIQLNKNIYGEFVPWTGAYVYFPMPEERLQWKKAQWLGWREAGITIAYRPNHLHGGYVFPNFSTWQYGDFFRFGYQNGMVGFDFDSLFGHWAVKGPMLYVQMRLFVDPTLEVARMRSDYFSAFGPAAAQVETYFDYWENRSGVRGGNPLDIVGAYPESAFNQGESLLEQALQAARGSDLPEYEERVEFLKIGMHHARLAARFFRLTNNGQLPDENTQQFKDIQDALAELIAWRRQYEHLYFADLVDASQRENRRIDIDRLMATMD